jgi:hypothetical protein
MKRKEFRLLIEGFNKFLLNETKWKPEEEYMASLNQEIPEKFSIPGSFKDLVSNITDWKTGEKWIDSKPYDEPEFDADEKKIVLAVAEAFGRDYTQILANHHNNDNAWFSNTALEDRGYYKGVFDLIDNYIPPANLKHSPLMGKFVIDGQKLDGFYFNKDLRGAAEAVELFKFINPRSIEHFNGSIFIAPALKSQDSPTTKVFTAPAIINDTGAEVEDEEYH